MDYLEKYHGVEVNDPYRWLEKDVRDSEEVNQWVISQNKVTFDYLSKIPERLLIKDRMTELWDFERYGLPIKKNGRYGIRRC